MQESRYLELRIDADCISDEAFAALCERLGALGFALETNARCGRGIHIAWFAAEKNETAQRASLAAAALLSGAPANAVRISSLYEKDWATAWQRHWHGQSIGESLWVRPSFCPPADNGRIDIVLDPGMAFGTGTHPTTRLCLIAIERICRHARPPQAVLDMGAGTGILAIAALKLGAGSALAIDIDEQAVAACKTNARINNVRLKAARGSTPPRGKFDLVIANILAEPLVGMASRLAECVAGKLILSGMLDSQVDMVSRPYLGAGLDIERLDHEDGWAAITMTI